MRFNLPNVSNMLQRHYQLKILFLSTFMIRAISAKLSSTIPMLLPLSKSVIPSHSRLNLVLMLKLFLYLWVDDDGLVETNTPADSHKTHKAYGRNFMLHDTQMRKKPPPTHCLGQLTPTPN